MFKDRALTALWGMILFLFLLLVPWGKGLPFFLFLLLIAIMGMREFFNALKDIGLQPFQFIGIISILIFFTLTFLNLWNVLFHSLVGMLIFCFLWGLTFHRGQNLLINIGVTLLGIIYIGGLFSYLLMLSLSEAYVNPPIASFSTGSWLCAIVVVTNWVSDICSYLIGKHLGKRHIFPKISPNKTLEGLVGGMIFAIVGGTILGNWSGIKTSTSSILALTIALSAPLGDLAESALKRELGIKDFGSILPGHGGILDRFDSLLFSSFFSFQILNLLDVIK